MMKKENKHGEFVFYTLMIIAVFVFLCVFSVYTSPLTKLQGNDAAFFRLVGQGMTKGMLPYRDFFDMKGPYLFLVEYISQCICYGRTGCFIYQCLNLIAVFCLLDRIHRIAAPKLGYIKRFLLCLPYVWIMAATFQGGNLTEEFSLPFILLCVYCAIRYLYTGLSQAHPARYGLIYGACFGIITFIRITNAVTICALVLYILIRLIISKNYKSIFQNALAFIAGFLLASAPAVIYCLYNGIFTEMIDCVFLFGATYAGEDGMINWFFLKVNKLVFVLPLLLPLILCFASAYKNRAIQHLVILDTLFLALTLSMGRSYPHYFTLLIPHVALGLFLIAHNIESSYSAKTSKYTIFICVCLIGLLKMVLAYGYYFLHSATSDFGVDHDAIAIAENIPAEDADSVYTYGISSKWYTETGLYPCIRYCDWQDNYVDLRPEIGDELIEIFHATPPKWVVTENSEQTTFLQAILDEQYASFAENESYILWALTE